MKQFIIQPEISWFTNPTTSTRQRGIFISKSINAFCHADYNGGGMWKIEGSIENMIWTLKNDVSPFPQRLPFVKQQFTEILQTDLPQILTNSHFETLTVCVIPRSKEENYYRADQLFFRQIVSSVVNNLNGFANGTAYIVRHTDTRTTHLDRNGEGGNGNLPYPGITKNTCIISDNVKGKDILLIDDLYTKSVNIDEDAIKTLLDKGAKSVIFYAVGKTVHNPNRNDN
ncbi:MAG: phosphoribosyltransferase [Prevotellaceae bacterium]|jgi:hypothetical protein|nr:phosphoribosyltransferase [Prevotellaceae bacterium]